MSVNSEIEELKKRLKVIEESRATKDEERLETEFGYREASFDFFGKNFLTEKGRILANNKVLSTIIAFQMFLIVFLLFGYYKVASRETFSVLMPDYGNVEVSRMSANPLYFKIWGNYALQYLAEFTPSNIDNNIQRGLKLFDKYSWKTQEPYIDQYAKVIKANLISQEFRFNEEDVVVKIAKNGSKAKVIYKGIATQKVGNLKEIEVECRYEFTFFIRNGKPFQETASTNCLSGGDKK